MVKQHFGGKWTVEKLDIFSQYLSAYLKVMKNQRYQTTYIDAFAGTGKIDINGTEEQIEGSVRLALNCEDKFGKYIFIEKNNTKAEELKTIIESDYKNLANKIEIERADCNTLLKAKCKNTNWHSNRALLFLDPFSTEVEWSTLEAIASTQAIDVWYLFPFSAAQRMLKKDGKIDESWKMKLNSLFGDDNWYNEFYVSDPQLSFIEKNRMIKNVNSDGLSGYIIKRLQSIFPAVAKESQLLYNTKNSPLFFFCFAVANPSPRAQKIALDISGHILNHSGN